MTQEQMDVLLDAIRRQGRASIAAQSAAEACLEAVRRDPRDEPNRRLLAVLLPVFDTVERLAEQVRRVRGRRRSRVVNLLDRTGSLGIGDLLDAVLLLHGQLEAALASAGVTVDRETDVPVDGERHRVVEVRRAGSSAGRVLEVVRAGYNSDGRVFREADVVATGGR